MKKIEIVAEGSMVYVAMLDEKELGRMEYTNWYSDSKAIITINGNEYKLGPKGFWHTTTDIFKEEKVVFNIAPRWQGGFTITASADSEKPFIFHNKGWFKTGYEVVDYQNQVLFDIQGNFSWKKMSPGYSVSCSVGFANDEADILLLILSVHMYKAQQSAVLVGATA